MNNKKIKLSGIIFPGVIIIVSFFYAINIQPVVIGDPVLFKTNTDLNNFNTYNELTDFSKNKSDFCYNLNCESKTKFKLDIPNGINIKNKIVINFKNNKNINHSVTNIQVDGVDESDIVKTDHKNIYFLANSKIYKINAYQTLDPKVLATIYLENNEFIINLFINKNRCINFATSCFEGLKEINCVKLE